MQIASISDIGHRNGLRKYFCFLIKSLYPYYIRFPGEIIEPNFTYFLICELKT